MNLGHHNSYLRSGLASGLAGLAVALKAIRCLPFRPPECPGLRLGTH